MEVAALRGPSAEKWRQVFEVIGNEIAHLPFALPGARHCQRNDETWKGKELGALSDRFNHECSQAEMKEMAARMLALAEDAFDLQVLLNVNSEDQGGRAAYALIELLSSPGDEPLSDS